MAMVHDICVGKTGTMTTGKMNVKKYQLGDQMTTHFNDHLGRPDGFKLHTENEAPKYLKDLINMCILGNNDVRMAVHGPEEPAARHWIIRFFTSCFAKKEKPVDSNEFYYMPEGQSIEVGMTNFIIQNGEDIYDLIKRRNLYQTKKV